MTAQEAREEITAYLSQPFDKAVGLSLAMQIAESRTYSLQSLTEARANALMPKDIQWTDFDRKIMVDGFVAEKEREYELLLALETLFREYLTSHNID